jgi:hypothetical protein
MVSFLRILKCGMNQVPLELDLNEYSVLAALLIDSKNFCGDGSHFLRLTSPEMPPVFKDSGPRKGARGGERVRDIRPCRR